MNGISVLQNIPYPERKRSANTSLSRKGLLMELSQKHCLPCEGSLKPMNTFDEDEYSKQVPLWHLDRSGVHRIKRLFEFEDFRNAIAFVNRVADIAEEEGHHPNFYISNGKVLIELYTHAINGLSENDFIVAALIDRMEMK
jgi:4a-hydroxytetrahydrobiopterin dehydratase